MQDAIFFLLKNPQSLIGLVVWFVYVYQLYRCIKFYKLGYNFPITEIAKSSSGFGRFKLNLQTNEPIFHPVTKEKLAGFQIEFWIRDTRYRRLVGRKTFLAQNLCDGDIRLDLNDKTFINTKNEEFFIKVENVKENLSLYNLAREILGNKKDLWRNKITDLSLPIVVYIKSIGLKDCTILAYLDKENNIVRSFRPEEKFATVVFDQNYNTKLRQFFQNYRIFALGFFALGLPIIPFVGIYNSILAIWLIIFWFISIMGVYFLSGLLDIGTFDEI